MAHFIEGKGGILLPYGSDADKRSEFGGAAGGDDATEGMIRYNTDEKKMEMFRNHQDGWDNFAMERDNLTRLITEGDFLDTDHFSFILSQTNINQTCKLMIECSVVTSIETHTYVSEVSLCHNGHDSLSIGAVVQYDEYGILYTDNKLDMDVTIELDTPTTTPPVPTETNLQISILRKNIQSAPETIHYKIFGIVYEFPEEDNHHFRTGVIPMSNIEYRMFSQPCTSTLVFKWFLEFLGEQDNGVDTDYFSNSYEIMGCHNSHNNNPTAVVEYSTYNAYAVGTDTNVSYRVGLSDDGKRMELFATVNPRNGAEVRDTKFKVMSLI